MFSYEIYEIFKNTVFYRTPLLWWFFLTVNSVNQWKHALKVYAAEKEMICITVLLRLVFPDQEYSSKVFRTLLALLDFSEVAVT